MQRIDLDQRRRKISQIAADVIAREGIEAATFRQIAAQAGSSTTFITKYFVDKQELLLSAYRLVSTDTLAQFGERVAQNSGGLIESLTSLCALDEKSWCGWRVHIAFWEKAARDPIILAELRLWIANSRTVIEDAIRAGYGDGGNLRGAAQLVIALIHGISIEILFEPKSWSHDQIQDALSKQLETALGRGPAVVRARAH